MESSDVFVSYRRADVEFVKRLTQALKDTGREVWVDWEDIPPGVEGFADEIQRGIEATNAFIAVLSPPYLESPYCLMELKEALRLKKRIIPVVLKKFDPAPPPEGIGHINWVYFTPHAGQENTFEQGMELIKLALETDYEHAREHTRLLLRANEWEKKGRNNSYLLSGAEIDQAEQWQMHAAEKMPPVIEQQTEYIFTSRKVQRQQQQRITAGIGVLLVLAVIAAIYAIFQANAARKSQAAAHSSALAAAALLPGNEEIAVALALEGARSPQAPDEVFNALAQVVYPVGSIRYWLDYPKDLGTFYNAGINTDGSQLIIGNELYDMRTGAVLTTFENTPGYVISSLFMPDGKHAIIAGDDDGYNVPGADPVFVGLYDLETGALVRKFDVGIGIWRVDLSANATTLIAYHPDQSISLWDVESGQPLATYAPINPTYEISHPMAISPDLQWLATVEWYNPEENPQPNEQDFYTLLPRLIIRSVNASENAYTIELPGDSGAYYNTIYELQFSNDSGKVAVFAAGQLGLYSVSTGALLIEFNDVLDQGYKSLRFNRDDSLLLASNINQTVTFWDTISGERLFVQSAHSNAVTYAGFSLNGEQILSVDADGVFIVWDAFPGNLLMRMKSTEYIIAISADGTQFITQYMNQITVRDAETQSIDAQFFLSGVSPTLLSDTSSISIQVNDVDIANNRILYSNSALTQDYQTVDVELHLASLTNGTDLREWTFPDSTQLFLADILQDGEQVLLSYFTESEGSRVVVLDAKTGDVVRTMPEAPQNDQWFEIAVSPDGTHLVLKTATEENGNTYQLLDARTGGVLSTYSFDQDPERFIFSPDGKMLILTSFNKEVNGESIIQVLDVKTGALQHQVAIREDPFFSNMQLLDNGKYLLANSFAGGGGGIGEGTPSGIYFVSGLIYTGGTRLWDTETGELVWDFNTRTSAIVAYPQGVQFYTSDTEYIKLWVIGEPEDLIQWACNNRYIKDFTPAQRARLNITSTNSVCAESNP